MMVLNEGEVCPYSARCPYAIDCQGPNPNRKSNFTCDYVTNGIISDGQNRNLLDQTGKMKIILE